MTSHIYITQVTQVCVSSSTEGECSRSASGVMMRSGAGKHTSEGGVIYTGEWHGDKVCIYCACVCVCASLPLMWLLIHALSPHRCMAEGPCSIPPEHYMKENSKTTCTTAREHTPSQTAVLTRVTFRRTGEKKESIFGT